MVSNTNKYRYVTDTVYQFSVPELNRVEFKNEWIEIRNSAMTIQQGYAWDGATPSKRLPVVGWVGVPEGPLTQDGRPVSWKATLIHDALCQYRKDIRNINKSDTVALFKRCLEDKEAPAWMRVLYPFMIDNFGPQKWG